MFEYLDFNSEQKKQIENDLNNHRFSHAVILEGSDSFTREKAATEIASFLLCIGEKKPCGECRSCKKIEHSSHPDLHILSLDPKASSIKVDQVREIKEQAALMPNDSDRSVFVLLDAQNMNTQAQNALLKIFEEPSSSSFILTVPSKSGLLETIVSRGSIYSLSSEHKEQVDDDINDQANSTAEELIIFLTQKREFDFSCKLAEVQKDRDYLNIIINKLVENIRLALANKNGIDEAETKEKKKLIEGLALRFSIKELIAMINKCNKVKSRLDSNGNYNLTIAMLSSCLFK